ncbi:MAG: 1-acyl-sn-glycerol-3-phosphate acyltransferase [Parachlamydiaceae bacterium]
MSHLKTVLDAYVAQGKLPSELAQNLYLFYESYLSAILKNGYSTAYAEEMISQLIDEAVLQIEKPFHFEFYHRRILEPFDYYQFGIKLFKPLIDLKHSEVRGLAQVDQIAHYLSIGDNVILLANHQTEPDPQVISILLENSHPKLAEEMIFVAGHRVTTDPLAVPFSKGRNLLCIYSKKHIENPPELKTEKLLHNQRTLKRMGELLDQGGTCIYVAPSGGRDRLNSESKIEVAPFDPQSVDLFFLLAQKASKTTHFFPLALSTFHLLPPPSVVEKKIGERRHANSIPVYLSFGKEIFTKDIPLDPSHSKQVNRIKRAHFIWNLVYQDYLQLP